MRTNPHRTELLNVVNAARQLGMSVHALGQRIRANEIETEYHGGYVFVPLDEISRFADARREEARAAEVAEQEQRDREQREADGSFIVREMAHLRGLARQYGFDPDQD